MRLSLGIGLLCGCNGADSGVELGMYRLTPENRDFQLELLEDGTFSIRALELDLDLFDSGVWEVQEERTVLRPPDDDPEGDAVRDDLCPTRCMRWSTTDGFTQVTRVYLEPTDDPEVIEAELYDRVKEKDVVQAFVWVEPG